MTRRQTVIIDNSAQKPEYIGFWELVHSNFHWKCLLSTLLVHLCSMYALWCYLKSAYDATVILTYTHGPCSQGYNFIPISFGLLLYMIYLTECWHSRAKTVRIPQTHLNAARDYINRLRYAHPIVWWRSVCYHYLRRSRQVTRYRNGDAVTGTQIYYERVNTHTAGNVFSFEMCGFRDISKALVELEKFPLIRLYFSKGFVFACVQAANEFEAQRTRFFNQNESRDDYMEVREGLDLVETPFVEQMIVYTSPSLNIPWYLRGWVFWCCSILLLSWPLRMFVECRTAHVNYQATKLFGTNYLSPSSVNYTGPLSRTSTMEATELERVLRENYLIVPSYSEAVLLDPVPLCNVLIPGGYRCPAPALSPQIANERLISNYGAVQTQRTPPQALPSSAASQQSQKLWTEPPRSRSMCFIDPPRTATNSVSTHLPRVKPTQISATPRSISIAGISAAARFGGFNSVTQTPFPETDERQPLLTEPMSAANDDPPPSYEVALRMCVPFYQRLRQSAGSISSLLNSLSRSNSKDLR